ncbi:TrbG/VirB9 family P-type conjugative transfer protein [Rubrivirga litoralis]|uniref:TrbG/VirB9 family P-type conjugative transfer protein n=1 Tax=Rubrivirga litoralis TaxID=3075598 RepID=A0ABU3BUN2_9BACT|nr:TrbG/VirB9 family P-type conjugative transfer protein [Rubrivirga sp. F394]MDT0632945.1 TrbG/VirB9 family P-type conjugative transfer protein [Rubrivirga sp. F394]
MFPRLALPLLALALASGPARSQVSVAALDTYDPPPVGAAVGDGFTSGAVVVTPSQMEDALTELLYEYRDTGRARTLRQSTMMIFPYGHSQPVLATAPLRASVIELEPGEIVFGMAAGDTERFAYEMSYTGQGGDTPIVLVKPLDTGITTNLVISTDRRIYHVTLDAAPSNDDVLVTSENPQGRYARHIKFYYPDAALARLADGLGAEAAFSAADQGGTLASLSDLHFEYRVDGDDAVEESVRRVYDDGVHTYIELTDRAQRSGSAPALFVLGPDGRRESLNYVLRDGRYITDRVFGRAELVLGATVRKGLFGLGGKRQVERKAVLARLTD